MLFNDYWSIFFVFLDLIWKLALPNLSNLLTMKNLKRFVILIALIFVAGKVLFSDFEIIKPDNNATAIVSE